MKSQVRVEITFNVSKVITALAVLIATLHTTGII